ncbi:hypothetical protein DdX_14256 [Ditylenchus destructor]|uniref:Uncharacterized protein n=1 Tax=Ditylenchus destructor TaxID=166010 RepID=A0AAD4MX31_9BILA|nr:hypothetical protein DdX_14256 [Ditylenchus destructor]
MANESVNIEVDNGSKSLATEDAQVNTPLVAGQIRLIQHKTSSNPLNPAQIDLIPLETSSNPSIPVKTSSNPS